MGSGIMIRAFAQAYRQALANASKTGAAQEAVETIKRGSKMMTDAEARQILGVTENTSWEEIVKVSPFSDSVSFSCTLNKRLRFLCPNS
ncbi:mitochondrial import inner membrane translocase subunit PAM16 like 1-like [Salvia splendens]|uniref:mitochondrial import inner membrane translocase subunit PAM16 like 1-like n=1 Tax=Salvia splendens TaxID=180675 RepID=UPI001C25CAA4|nr:mitochondrial import inner membrane translocase subunit PAM16 like 1-like [Salvia splendens]